MTVDKPLAKLFHAYDKAHSALAQERDKRFPPGSRARTRVLGMEVVIKAGSLYPDQVLTNMGHMSWRLLERMT